MEQTSPPGATTADDCFPRYQAAEVGQPFCYGKGSVENSDSANANAAAADAALTQIDDSAGQPVGTACKEAVEGLGYTFNGVRNPPRGCVADPAAGAGWYYVRDKDHGKATVAGEPVSDDTLAPVCERYTCDDTATEDSGFLTKDSAPDAELECKVSVAAVNAAVEQETATNFTVFFPPVAGVIAFFIIAAYAYFVLKGLKKTLTTLPRSVHYWIWWGMSLRVFDISTDWGFFGISVKSLAFQAACDAEGITADYDAIRLACLAFSIVGTVLGPLDIWGSYQRLINKEAATAGWIILAISVLEDLPQLALNANYISIMYRYRQLLLAQRVGDETINVQPFDPISMISLTASVANICFNIALMISTVAVRQMAKKVEATEAQNAEYRKFVGICNNSGNAQPRLNSIIVNPAYNGDDEKDADAKAM